MAGDVQIWRYVLPTIDGMEGWGIFLLDSTGMFAAVTDYGNYAYKWTHHGCKDFREFVIKLAHERDYLLGKVLPNGKEYDGEKTLKEIKEYILGLRRDGSYTKEHAREEWDLMDECDLDNEFGFCRWYDRTRISDAYELERNSYPASALAFAKKMIPRLAEILKAELEAVA